MSRHLHNRLQSRAMGNVVASRQTSFLRFGLTQDSVHHLYSPSNSVPLFNEWVFWGTTSDFSHVDPIYEFTITLKETPLICHAL